VFFFFFGDAAIEFSFSPLPPFGMHNTTNCLIVKQYQNNFGRSNGCDWEHGLNGENTHTVMA